MDHHEDSLAWSEQIDVSTLSKHQSTEFNLVPDRSQCAKIAESLAVLDISKLRFTGHIHPQVGGDWRLVANLGASLTQACIATLNPVKTRIDDRVERRFVKNQEDLAPRGEAEIPEDMTLERLTDRIDLGQVMYEALALRIPLFPRDPGADPVDITVTEPDADPLQEEDMRPFSQLKSLRDKMGKTSE